MADLLRGVFVYHEAQRLLLAAGYTIRLGRGDHRVIRCRCGQASAVLPASPKHEITRGLQGRGSRRSAPSASSPGPRSRATAHSSELVGAQDPVTTCEWILKPGTNYLVRMTNDAAGAIGPVVRVGLLVVPFRKWFTARAS